MRLNSGYSILILVALVVLVLAPSAQADPITWTLVGVTSLGSTITGSFTYNADTQTYSDIDIVTTGGSVIPNTTYAWLANFSLGVPGAIDMVDSAAANQTNADLLALIFATPLTDAGGTINLYATQQGRCADAGCTGAWPYGPDNYIVTEVTGTVVASTAVPEPGTLVLLAGGLLAACGTIRRKLSI